MRQIIRAALRVVRHDPGYAIAFALTLGLGIGATTAIFSAVEGVLIRPLPYPHADRIVYARQPLARTGQANALFSFVEVADYREQTRTIEELVEYGDWTFNVVGLGEPRVASGGLVTSNYFKVLAIRPHLGRVLTPEDDRRGSAPVAVLTYEFWRRAAGADPNVLNQAIELSGVATTIVGVLEPGSHYAGTERAELYANYPTNAHYMSATMQGERQHRMTDVYALIKPGVTLEIAQADVELVSNRLHTEHPKDYPASQGFQVTLTPWREVLVQKARPTLLILMGAVGLVLLVACANVGNLTLARLVKRERELSVRAALGATPAQLRGQLLIEHLVLATAGSVLGVGIAAVARQGLADYAARFTLRADAVGINWAVLAFSLGVGIAAATFFAWAPRLPAAGSATSALTAGMSGGRATSGRAQRQAQRALVVAQVAVSFVVLVGAGLLVRTFINLQHVDPGFDDANVLSLRAPNFTRLPPDKNRAVFDEASAKILTLPGVDAVATTSRAPYSVVSVNTFYLRTETGKYSEPAPPLQMLPTTVSPTYFSALKIPILRGRALGAEDTTTAPRAVVINDTMARLAFGSESPLNRRIQWSFDGSTWPPARTIVGVSKDVRDLGAGRPALPSVYESSTQVAPGPSLLVRTRGDAAAAGREAARVIHELDPKRAVTDVQLLSASAAERVAPWRLNATLFGSFALLALAIAAVGVGGVLAFSVSERTREFGIRMALGSAKAQILRGILQEGLTLSAVGLGLGVAGALLLSRFLEGLLFEVTPLDVVTFAATAATLVLVALGASWLPAHRATKVDPVVALRAQ
jgi:putative ABC transport system permease protein